MNALANWFDHRTGYRHILREVLYEPIPGGARWRYVWGSTLTFTFAVQMITGLFLWTAYSPSAQTAWESVYYIQNQMVLGNLVRGIHHFAAQAMMVLLALHFLQVVIDGAYRAPREVNFWLGLILMQIVLGLSLTGYLLPWDQKGYYATQVATKIMGATPLIGPQLQTLIQGGTQYGHHTLTRFFALHAGILPTLLMLFLALHIYVFRRHAITVVDPKRAPATTFWPDQVLKDAIACLAVLVFVLAFAIGKGAELSAPANPAQAYSAARPEWYFLFLFQFLRFEVIEHLGVAFGAIVVPSLLMLVIVLMPLIGRSRWGHRFNVAFVMLLMVAIGVLTAMSLYVDSRDPEFQRAVAEAEVQGHRTVELADHFGIPVDGAQGLLRVDPLTQGPRIFARRCAACHHYNGENGLGVPLSDPPTAADLGNFGTREWHRRVLIHYDEVFAPLKNTDEEVASAFLEGDMAGWSEEHRELLENKANAESVNALVEFLAAQSGRKDLQPFKQDLVDQGRAIFETGELAEGSFSSACIDCHSMHIVGEEEPLSEDGYAPNLTGYAGGDWLRSFISDPGAPEHYGDKNVMPAFGERLSPHDLDMLVRWLTGDYYTAVSPK